MVLRTGIHVSCTNYGFIITRRRQDVHVLASSCYNEAVICTNYGFIMYTQFVHVCIQDRITLWPFGRAGPPPFGRTSDSIRRLRMPTRFSHTTLQWIPTMTGPLLVLVLVLATASAAAQHNLQTDTAAGVSPQGRPRGVAANAAPAPSPSVTAVWENPVTVHVATQTHAWFSGILDPQTGPLVVSMSLGGDGTKAKCPGTCAGTPVGGQCPPANSSSAHCSLSKISVDGGRSWNAFEGWAGANEILPLGKNGTFVTLPYSVVRFSIYCFSIDFVICSSDQHPFVFC